MATLPVRSNMSLMLLPPYDNREKSMNKITLARKGLAFSKDRAMYQASDAWEDLYYNLARPVKTLRLK